MPHAMQGKQTEFNAGRAKVCCSCVCVCLRSFNAKFNFLNYTTVEVESLDERGEILCTKSEENRRAKPNARRNLMKNIKCT